MKKRKIDDGIDEEKEKLVNILSNKDIRKCYDIIEKEGIMKKVCILKLHIGDGGTKDCSKYWNVTTSDSNLIKHYAFEHFEEFKSKHLNQNKLTNYLFETQPQKEESIEECLLNFFHAAIIRKNKFTLPGKKKKKI